MKRELSKESYRQAVDRVHAPAELVKRVEAADTKTIAEKHRGIRRGLWTAAAALAVFGLSNLVVYAATGQPWVSRVFDWDAESDRPMENIAEFFKENAELFESDYPRRDCYGGTYLDGGEQVILLTDMSRSVEFSSPGENVRFEKCEYTYAELIGAINAIREKLVPMKQKEIGYASDVISWWLEDAENRVCVSIYFMNDEKVRWFKENISDAPYLVFSNTQSLPQDMDAN